MSLRRDQKGFTLLELIVVMGMSSLLVIVLFVFTSNAIQDYMYMQAEGLANSKAAEGSFRVSRVIRGSNYIEEAAADRYTAYAYFAPQDEYTSKITYYLSGDQKQLLADVTAMTADFPIGSLIPETQRTVIVIDNFLKRPSFPTFQYTTANHTELEPPIADLQAIKNVSVNIYTRLYEANDQKYVSSSVSVNLRNRKKNL